MGRETSPVATFVSYRLGGTDGVSIEAAKWMGALEARGFRVRRVAGELAGPPRPDDLALSWLALEPPADAPKPDGAAVDALTDVLDPGDLTVVENVCSLPLNLDASRAVADAVMRIVRDAPLRRRLIAEGYATARAHTLQAQAARMMHDVSVHLGLTLRAPARSVA